MNIDHLKLFVRIANTNNISVAGRELNVSPAVASAHINKLEENLGAAYSPNHAKSVVNR